MRRLLIESAWHCVPQHLVPHPAGPLSLIDPTLRAHGHAGNRRLGTNGGVNFTERGKNPLVPANVAVAVPGTGRLVLVTGNDGNRLTSNTWRTPVTRKLTRWKVNQPCREPMSHNSIERESSVMLGCRQQ